MATPQAKVLAILPKITGGISFICSAYLVQHILRDPRKRKATYHRLVCGMSIGDCFGSFFGFVLSTWPMPKESGIWGASGNLQTVAAAGFFNQAGNLITPMYNGMLAIFYLLLLRYNWTDSRIKKIEPWLHAIPMTLGWGTAFAGLFLDLYGPANWISWIAPFPSAAACQVRETCERGYNFNFYRWAFLYAEVWFTMVYVVVIMLMIYMKVRDLETNSDKYRFRNGKAVSAEDRLKRRAKSRRVMNQSFYFVGAFFLTWIFGTITRLIQTISGLVYYEIIVLMTIFFPLQGFFNFVIYKKATLCPSRPKKTSPSPEKPEQAQQQQPKRGLFGFFRRNEPEQPEISKTQALEASAPFSVPKGAGGAPPPTYRVPSDVARQLAYDSDDDDDEEDDDYAAFNPSTMSADQLADTPRNSQGGGSVSSTTSSNRPSKFKSVNMTGTVMHESIEEEDDEFDDDDDDDCGV
mmetsp:Transcript_55292/g.83662  ORF Transcript_55292/g.83662 Transcript_55292/m.83662 type:complete len:464 (+) Transcript_55292:119-1510(+)|eukprot:CAMPEP_0117025772 /NCGR_PEP_ID=MMETSP0472-20121206/19008_1 /TAXON_ID=693140 ORGANISM="Tiarina fusus, Strain LIS" /NCGR_SAMPLE_ID=MMETSP0472 /ASSEMBLY_ACC=CAM_ASM_000603 /LENGTH=463 /DNA_ID=CAMNT_0004732587 /DNA_START=156 /DNA_END=1547 /DNA_ORIENTATION=-